MVKRQKGDRSSNILNTLDLEILKILKKQDKDVGILQLGELVGMSHRALKGHVRHLLKIKLIEKKATQKHGKIPLKITEDGLTILNVLSRNMK